MASRKGKPNKLSATAKENIAAVFIRLGGTAAMASWAEENKSAFYTKVYPRIVPVEVGGKDGAPISVTWALPRNPLDES